MLALYIASMITRAPWLGISSLTSRQVTSASFHNSASQNVCADDFNGPEVEMAIAENSLSK
jgi:hypothetical protein